MAQNFIHLDRDRPIEPQLVPLLRQDGFDDPTALQAFEDRLIRLNYKGGANVPYDQPERIHELAKENYGPAIEAIHNARCLLSTWGLSDKTSVFSKEDEKKVLQNMKFGNGSKKHRYGDKRWPPETRREALLYNFGFETPENTLAPIIENIEHMLAQEYLTNSYIRNEETHFRMKIALHRKPVTWSCEAAVAERLSSETGMRGIPLDQELKSVLFRAHQKDSGQEHYIAMHIDGSKTIPDPNLILQSTLLASRLEVDGFDHALAEEFGLATGRVNVFSLQQQAEKLGKPLFQIFDSALYNTRSGYTNIGANSWGLEVTDDRGPYLFSAHISGHAQNKPLKYFVDFADFSLIESVNELEKERIREEELRAGMIAELTSSLK